MNRSNISVGGGNHHVVHEDAGGGEDLLQHGLGLQAVCRGEHDVEHGCGGDGSDGLELQQHVQGV